MFKWFTAWRGTASRFSKTAAADEPNPRSRDNGVQAPAADIQASPPKLQKSSIRSGILPPGTRLYAVGDIHGRADLLERLLAFIEADHQARERAQGILVFLGDYVDRGGQSRGVVDRILAGALPDFTVHCLKGNHEDLLIRFLDDPFSASRWLTNGGATTLQSYGVQLDAIGAANINSADGVIAVRDLFSEVLPPDHLAFYRSLKTSYRCGSYFFVHGGVRPGVPLDRQREEDMLWIRDKFLNDRRDFGAVVVHGHTPAPMPEDLPNRIGIDTQAWRSGVLTAVGCEGADHWFLST